MRIKVREARIDMDRAESISIEIYICCLEIYKYAYIIYSYSNRSSLDIKLLANKLNIRIEMISELNLHGNMNDLMSMHEDIHVYILTYIYSYRFMYIYIYIC